MAIRNYSTSFRGQGPSSVFRPTNTSINCFMSYDELFDVNEFINRIKYWRAGGGPNLIEGGPALPSQWYTVFIKIRYDVDKFIMVGKQLGLHYESMKSIKDLYGDIDLGLDEYIGKYNLTGENVLYVQINFRILESKIYNNLKLTDKENLKVGDVRRVQSILSIPAFRGVEELKQIGSTLPVQVDSDLNITKIELSVNGVTINFWDNIKSKAKLVNRSKTFTSINGSYTFVYIKSNVEYVLAATELDSHTLEVIKYSLSGNLISRTIDNFGGSYLIRRKGNEELIINDKRAGVVTKSVTSIKLDNLNK